MDEVEDRLRRLQESINEKYDKIEALEALRDEQISMLEAMKNAEPSDMVLTMAELELAGLRYEKARNACLQRDLNLRLKDLKENILSNQTELNQEKGKIVSLLVASNFELSLLEKQSNRVIDATGVFGEYFEMSREDFYGYQFRAKMPNRPFEYENKETCRQDYNMQQKKKALLDRMRARRVRLEKNASNLRTENAALTRKLFNG